MNGFQNEIQLFNSLNGQQYFDLNPNLQKFIFEINKSVPKDKIIANKIGGENKSDLLIIVDNKQFNVSIKKGTGNSIHQEPVEEFIEFLEKNYKIDPYVFENIRHFIWGDETIDGSGDVSNRMSANQYKKKYPEKINSIQTYFNNHLEDLIKRFVIEGVSDYSSVDYLYYGDINYGKCISSGNIIRFMMNNSSNGLISIGRMSFQAWNRNLNGGVKSESKRGSIQLKWGTLKSDVELI